MSSSTSCSKQDQTQLLKALFSWILTFEDEDCNFPGHCFHCLTYPKVGYRFFFSLTHLESHLFWFLFCHVSSSLASFEGPGSVCAATTLKVLVDSCEVLPKLSLLQTEVFPALSASQYRAGAPSAGPLGGLLLNSLQFLNACPVLGSKSGHF